MRQKPKSAQPAQSPAAPEQPAACRAPTCRAFRCVSGDLRQLDRPDVDHARFARHRPETNHLRRAHLIDSWPLAEATTNVQSPPVAIAQQKVLKSIRRKFG